MRSFTWEEYKSIDESVQDILGADDVVFLKFDVFPLDYIVEDILTPQVFISPNNLVLVVDKAIEVYSFKEIWISTLGKEPKFSLVQQAFEFCPAIKPTDTPISKNLDIPDEWVRFSILEKDSQPKVFVLRDGEKPAKGYQTWALGQILKNTQRNYDDYRLRKMVHGNFSFFDGSFLVLAFVVFVVYVLISVLLGWILPGFVKTALDFLFAVFVLVVLGWQFWTIFVNVRKYRKIYELYKPKENPPRL